MEWLNIHISTLRSPEFIGSNPTERATWLCVLGYSVEQENGGRIVGGAAWKDRQWQQACGVTLREVRGADRLLKTDGDDLLVNGYPTAKESQVKQARSVALAGAMARWGKRNAATDADPMPVGMADGNAEGKGREQEGKGTLPPAASLSVTRPKDHWPMIQKEPWYLRGVRAGCRISATNWPAWQGAIERCGDDYEAFFAHAETMAADKRWHEKIEAATAKPARKKPAQGPKWIAWLNAGGTGIEPEPHE